MKHMALDSANPLPPQSGNRQHCSAHTNAEGCWYGILQLTHQCFVLSWSAASSLSAWNAKIDLQTDCEKAMSWDVPQLLS